MITPEMLAAPGTEHAEQAALFCWAANNTPTYPELGLLFAIPNGGERNKIVASRLKATGVKRGVPDMFLPVRRGPYGGLFIELKRVKHGKTQDEQAQWINYLRAEGYAATVCRGWLEATGTIASYLLLPPSSVVVGKFR